MRAAFGLTGRVAGGRCQRVLDMMPGQLQFIMGLEGNSRFGRLVINLCRCGLFVEPKVVTFQHLSSNQHAAASGERHDIESVAHI